MPTDIECLIRMIALRLTLVASMTISISDRNNLWIVTPNDFRIGFYWEPIISDGIAAGAS